AKDFNEIDTQSILQKEINYIGSRSQKPSSWQKTMKILSDQVISPEQIVTSIISLENWKDGFENSIAAKDIKVVIDLEKDGPC
ncbi:MAG: sorbitol dehydrogenase, partial [Tetragenococcus koreensis]|nr:sorbitol dehydrogenase [Tetragenococcus koreensis]MDN6496022.1 sorbitol dehydrogenase [Tetragenococcus koreensis]MDN6578602.1 sorbitol dehydrogenase [Tetragenococcus koreensis]